MENDYMDVFLYTFSTLYFMWSLEICSSLNLSMEKEFPSAGVLVITTLSELSIVVFICAVFFVFLFLHFFNQFWETQRSPEHSRQTRQGLDIIIALPKIAPMCLLCCVEFASCNPNISHHRRALNGPRSQNKPHKSTFVGVWPLKNNTFSVAKKYVCSSDFCMHLPAWSGSDRWRNYIHINSVTNEKTALTL